MQSPNNKLKILIESSLALTLFISTAVHADRYQDIMNRLDDLEDQMLFEEVLRSARTSPSAGASNFKYITKGSDETDYLIDLRSIKRKPNGNIIFIKNTMSDRPRYISNVVYFTSNINEEIDCVSNTFRDLSSIFYAQDSTIAFEIRKYRDEFIPINETSVINRFKNFLCR